MASAGQAQVVDQLFSILGALAETVGGSPRRASAVGTLRAARWWRAATARIDEGEEALAQRGGFLVDVERDEALEADVLAYYIFGSMVLDRIATFATGAGPDGAWRRWLRDMDRKEPEPPIIRNCARQLDLDLRVTRDKLVAHAGMDAQFTWGAGGAGLTTFGAVRVPIRQVPARTWKDALSVLHGVGFPGAHYVNPDDTLSLLDALRSMGPLLNETGRNAYRAVAEAFGLQAVSISSITWQVVELARGLLILEVSDPSPSAAPGGTSMPPLASPESERPSGAAAVGAILATWVRHRKGRRSLDAIALASRGTRDQALHGVRAAPGSALVSGLSLRL